MNESDLNALRVRVAELCPSLFVHVPSPFGPGGIHWKTGVDDFGHPVSPGGWVNLLNDLNACAELIKFLEADGWTVKLQNWLHRKATTWTCEFRKGLWVEEYESEELAVAICRAFIATMEGKSK